MEAQKIGKMEKNTPDSQPCMSRCLFSYQSCYINAEKRKNRHPKKLPLTIYTAGCKDKDDQTKYMTHQKVTGVIRKAVTAGLPISLTWGPMS